MKTKIKEKARNFFIPNIVYVLIFGFLTRLFLSFFGTLHLDQGTFVAWSNNLVVDGFKNFYNGWSDYLPGYLYILWFLGKINLLGFIPQVVLYKLPAIFSDLLTGFLIYKIIKKNLSLKLKKISNKNECLGLLGALIYIFNPAILANSSLWGQVDSLTALSVISSIYLFDKKYILSAIALAIGTLIKPQAAFVLPIILYLFVVNKRKLSELFFYCYTGLLVFILGFIPFSNGNFFEFIINRLSLSANQYQYTSVNAFNFWGLFGMWKPDNVVFQFGSYLLVILLFTVLLIKFRKKKISPYTLAVFIFTASFMLFTRMHERHLLPAFAPMAIILIENSLFIFPYLGLSIIYILNLLYSYKWITENFIKVYPDIFTKFLEIFGIFFLVFVFLIILKNFQITWKKLISFAKNLVNKISTSKTEMSPMPQIKLSNKKSKIILLLILIFAFTSRVYKLGSPTTMYFDEVYHAFTAKVMMGEDRAKAWEWWNTPPEGFAYEWTHPPLAKLGMVMGMSIFGQNSFGWRIPGVLLGVGSVFLIYLLAKEIFKDETIGLISAGVFSLDGLSLILSRIGMNDSYLLFFSLLSIYLFLKQKDAFSALSFGLALSSKWSALWVVPVLFILWLKRRNKFTPVTFLSFLFLPIAIYFLTYLPMFITGHTIETWWGMQKQMWWYHTRLDATHSYSSPAWTWPFLVRPVYLYTSDEIGGFVSRIYLMGNPFVFFSGFASVLMCAIYSIIERNKNLGIIVFSYLVFFVPWIASPRVMFLYHYLPSVPFLSIAIAYVLRRNRRILLLYIAIAVILFIYFYPHWTDIQIPLWLDKSYYWITSWR